LFAHLVGFISPVLGIPQPELTQGVVPPTFDRTTPEKRTTEHAARCEHLHGRGRSEGDGRKLVPHVTLLTAAASCVAEAKLTNDTDPPTLGATSRESHTGVPEAVSCSSRARNLRKRAPSVACAERECSRSFVRSERERQKRISHFIGFVSELPKVAQPELTTRVVPPALDRSIIEQRASVTIPGVEISGTPVASEIDER
jgi:hypothetical protein